MNRIRLAILLLLSVVSFVGRASAASTHAPTGITITCSCDDATGKAYVSAVRDLLAKDVHFREMSMEEGARKNAIRVNIISMPLESADGRPRAVLSIVCMHGDTMVHQFVETCTRIPIADCAQSMVQDLNDIVTN